MPSYSPIYRFTIALLLIVSANFASETVTLGQDAQWLPYRETDHSASRVARRVQQKQIRLPPPVRLAQHETVELKSIDSDRVERQDAFGTEITDRVEDNYFDNENRQTSHSILGADLGSDPLVGFASNSSPQSAPHLVIRSPATQTKPGHRASHVFSSNEFASDSTSHVEAQTAGHRFNFQNDSSVERIPGPPLHGQHPKLAKKKWLHGPTLPKRATIPGGRERAVWKQPYSYGYFGASSTRHWGTHHGYRDRYTEYRYQ